MNKTVAAALIALAGFSCAAAHATDTTLVLHGLSYHADRSSTYNERNAGAGLRVALRSDVALEAGAYNNSYRKTSAYVVVSYLPLQVGPARVGVFGGAATGYAAQTGQQLSPLAGAQAQLAVTRRVSVDVRWVPPAPGREKNTSVTTLSLGVRL